MVSLVMDNPAVQTQFITLTFWASSVDLFLAPIVPMWRVFPLTPDQIPERLYHLLFHQSSGVVPERKQQEGVAACKKK